MVLSKVPKDDRRWPTTRGSGGGGSDYGGDGLPMAGDDGEEAAGLLFTLAHLKAVSASGGDG